MNHNRDPEALMAAWLDDGPAELPSETRQAIVVGVRTLPRRRTGIRWPFGSDLPGPGLDLRRVSIAIAVIAVVAVVGAIAGAHLWPQSFAPAAALPTSSRDWSRTVIDADAKGSVLTIGASPIGLLAAVGEGPETNVYFSRDGEAWTRLEAAVPVNNPPYNVLVGGNRRLLMIGSEIVASDDGFEWQRVASAASDPALGQGTAIAGAAGGPGFVMVGADNKAWYSTDGTSWTLATVPQPPEQPVLRRPLDRSQTQGTVEMESVTASGNNLVAWGKQIWVHSNGSATFVPVFWASSNGTHWTSVPAPGGSQWNYPMVAGGRHGFIATAKDDPSVWLSDDGRSWERLSEDAFGASRWPTAGQGAPQNDDGLDVGLYRSGISAGPAGYVTVGADGVCMLSCSSEEAVIWTSPDGSSWQRMANDVLFQGNQTSGAGAGAHVIATWGDRFAVGGHVNGQPVVWISNSAPADNSNRPHVPTEVPTVAPIFSPTTQPSDGAPALVVDSMEPQEP